MSIPLSKIKKLPDAPGVYRFKKGRAVLYIGKATSLRDRVKSYLARDIADARGPLIVAMLNEATSVDFEETDSVLEALILEAALIKKHQPKYNTREKSDKSFNYVVITDEDYPRIFTMRERTILSEAGERKFKATFGPFPSGGQLKEALKIIRKIFPFRGKGDPAPVETGKRASAVRRSRLNQEIGIAPDFSRVSKRDYAKTIRNITLFFEGKKKQLLVKMEHEMRVAARKQDFERAQMLKRQLFALRHIQDVSLLRGERDSDGVRVEGYDVAHTAGASRVGVMVVVEEGESKKSDYRSFNIKTRKAGDTDALKEVLERRLKHTEWQPPRLIVVDGGRAQENTAKRVLADFGYQIPVVAVTKGPDHRPRVFQGDKRFINKHESDILLANREAHRFALTQHKKRRQNGLDVKH